MALDLAGLGGTPLVNTPSLRWRTVSEGEPHSPLASEGLSLLGLPSLGLLLAFGGYNGKYHNAVQVFRPGESSTALVIHFLPLLWASNSVIPKLCCWLPHTYSYKTLGNAPSSKEKIDRRFPRARGLSTGDRRGNNKFSRCISVQICHYGSWLQMLRKRYKPQKLLPHRSRW